MDYSRFALCSMWLLALFCILVSKLLHGTL